MIIREIEWGSSEYGYAVALRNELLSIPIGGTVFNRDLRTEKEMVHVAAFSDDGHIVGTLMLRPESETQFHVNQVAVSPALRGNGIGHKLMEFAENLAIAKGVKRLVLDSRQNALHFYQTCGFVIAGEDFGRPTLRLTPMGKNL